MKVFNWVQNLIQSIWNGVAVLFKPTNDDYPATGEQPFHGDPNKNNKQYY